MDSKLVFLVESLTTIADELYHDSQAAARSLLKANTRNPLIRIVRGVVMLSGSLTPRGITLTNCIFDLALTSYFNEVFQYIQDKKVASVLVDALLYQATGYEPSSPTLDDILDLGTENARGIHKFQLAHEAMPHIGDIEAWIFGKEFAAIMVNDPGNLAHIIPVAPFSLIFRAKARWRIRYLLYGTLPTRQEREALEALVGKLDKRLQEMAEVFAKQKDA
jgi:hypothetical protein